VQKQDIFGQFVASLEEGGFEISHRVVDCTEYSVPQQRRRMVLVCLESARPGWPFLGGAMREIAPRRGRG
jgi:site-specific DNA-cytosine methylase